ncbi:probable purple acid phosphatase 20 [Salvia miltiorrhiza]|uniref:probable purple acid phosphatase 20 n=1 Tax=Salvia miltiorrhiza TaxID=226208 RepID=UPI0025AD0833|nr:probable purple acid phosphatase 20 [Salvia miltiorrhiza]
MQVHISVSGKQHMRISWITLFPSSPTLYYGTSPGKYTHTAKASQNTYRFLDYDSGEIHDVVIGPLTPNTSYYYRCGSTNSPPEFSFTTPPSQFPIKFVVVGDLGQTDWTSSTLDRIAETKYDVLLLPGDLSYADMNQPKWDRFGIMVQPLASQRPWMVTQGNHEVERIKLLHPTPFTAYNARWVMPYEECASPSNLFYSFQAAGVHVIMLGSYADFRPASDQYRWLQADLGKVDRRRTPWVVAAVHAPWYNSNGDHQQEYESVGMMQAMEDLLFRARVDVVFAGHVHAYERFVRVYKDKPNECGAMHITVGTGGNHEGLASWFMDPQPKISAFREANYGHGQFSVVNASHAVWTWHKNDDGLGVASDTVWIRSLASIPACAKLSFFNFKFIHM